MKYLNILTVAVSGVLLASPSFAQNDAVDADSYLREQNRTPAAQSPINSAPVKDKTPMQLELEKGLEEAKAELEDKEILPKKIELAKRMHSIRPTREQVDTAVKRASLSYPQSQRKGFVDAMSMMLNYNAIERISIDAMVETYTLKELGAMVEYYSKPEAKSASMKVVVWATLVQPEIINMIDKDMMRIKTGQ